MVILDLIVSDLSIIITDTLKRITPFCPTMPLIPISLSKY